MKKKIIASLIAGCTLLSTIPSVSYAKETCCDRMRLKDTYITTEYSTNPHTYNCRKHGVVEYCEAKSGTKVYNKSCTSCGADWGNYRVKLGTTHTCCGYK